MKFHIYSTSYRWESAGEAEKVLEEYPCLVDCNVEIRRDCGHHFKEDHIYININDLDSLMGLIGELGVPVIVHPDMKLEIYDHYRE